MTIIDPTVISTAIVSAAAGIVSLVARDVAKGKQSAKAVSEDVVKDWPDVKAAAALASDVPAVKNAISATRADAKNLEARVVALETKAPAPVQDVTKAVEAEVKKQFSSLFPTLVTKDPTGPVAVVAPAPAPPAA